MAVKALTKRLRSSGNNNAAVALYRDPSNKLLQDYIDASDLGNADDNNGTGAHAWWLNMSHNLNQATGQFDGSDYQKYTPVLGVAWQGNTEATDFLANIASAKAAGSMVGALIKQLSDAKIEVNVIAHSMGNLVLLEALHLLGEEGKADCVNHAFLWEAAVPNTALSPTPNPADKNGTWSFPKAVNAAKSISILYSQNDNILGAIPSNQRAQIEINRQKPIAELLPALFLQALNLHSAYEMAIWSGVAVSDLFHADKLDSIYQTWVMQHPSDQYGKPFPTTLDNAVELYQNTRSQELSALGTRLDNALPIIVDELKAAGHSTLAHALEISSLVMARAALLGKRNRCPPLRQPAQLAIPYQKPNKP